MNKQTRLTQDKYRKARGGHSRWLQLSCGECGRNLFRYQKDGPGLLKRLYLDRIVNPPSGSKLVCGGCKKLLGVRTIYEKEKRPAFRLFVGAIAKKVVKGEK